MAESEEREEEEVRSTAVVRYAAIESPIKFSLLQCNTDLNLPPSNWLSSSAESYGLTFVLSNSTGSSFRMAQMFPDCVGELDVISDAENVKKLLKLPYSHGPVSMLVHRIRTTLLIDDMDIHKFMFRQTDGDWHSLKSFLSENIFTSEQSKKNFITHENKCRYVLQQENLTSKFLYRSIEHIDDKKPQKTKKNRSNKKCATPEEPKLPPLPEPNVDKELPKSSSEHEFARNVIWTFENIQMLLGTDVPIFGDGPQPGVILRLKDMSKPISVLTGIDYWLDNLMCNVPEVAMCYHIDGIVQKYELIKTEDLPFLEDCKFSPSLVRDVAQNILAFLKSNATKAGHTYWLFKGKDDDVVKLYDLTSLCSNGMVDSEQNPFTIPIALLLYRVARNMKQTPRVKRPTNLATIRMLLKNCLKLLPVEKFPQIVTSAHYMFADTLVPLNSNPAAPDFEDTFDIAKDDDKSQASENKNDKSNTDVRSLCLSSEKAITADEPNDKIFNEEEPEIMRDIEKRCILALEHIAEGIRCLKYFDDEVVKLDEDDVKKADPKTPIPMSYDSLLKETSPDLRQKGSTKAKSKKQTPKVNETIGSLLCKTHVHTMPTWQNPPDSEDNMAWKEHLKTLLYEKACLVYSTLAEHEYKLEKFGSCLKHVRYVLVCRSHLQSGSNCENLLMSFVLGRAGDCCYKIGKQWLQQPDLHVDDYCHLDPYDVAMIDAMRHESVTSYAELSFLPEEIDSAENMFQRSWGCYTKALEYENRAIDRKEIQRRLGNVCNEIASFYMGLAASMIDKGLDESTNESRDEAESLLWKGQVEGMFTAAISYLDSGVAVFKVVGDQPNLALLYSNMGRLMRQLIHFFNMESPNVLTNRAKDYYYKTINCYEMALKTIHKRKNPDIWDLIHWEYSTTLYTLSTLMQDYSEKDATSKKELEKEVAQMLSKAIEHCLVDMKGLRQPAYQYRAAVLHRRMGSLYHCILRGLSKDSTRKGQYVHLCQLHYEKALKLFLILQLPASFLRVQLERVALREFMLDHCAGANRMNLLQGILDLMLECEPGLKVLSDGITESMSYKRIEEVTPKSNILVHLKKEGNKEEKEEQLKTDEAYVLSLVESRTSFILRKLIKRSCSVKSQSKLSGLVSSYKCMYEALLRRSSDVPLADHLLSVFVRFRNIHD